MGGAAGVVMVRAKNRMDRQKVFSCLLQSLAGVSSLQKEEQEEERRHLESFNQPQG